MEATGTMGPGFHAFVDKFFAHIKDPRWKQGYDPSTKFLTGGALKLALNRRKGKLAAAARSGRGLMVIRLAERVKQSAAAAQVAVV
jgi:hypothetical protein